MSSGGFSLVIKRVCHCLSCGGGRYIVRFVHTALCIGIPSTFIFNKYCELHEWLFLHKGSYIYGFLYLGILLASLIFYYSACLTDPGYVDQHILTSLANDEDEEELFTQRADAGHGYLALHTSDPSGVSSGVSANGDASNTQSINHNSSNSVAIIDTDEITNRDDTVVHNTSAAEAEALVNRSATDNTTRESRSTNDSQQASHVRMCKICNIPQPLRSHHCGDCKRCVLKFDHHCPWLSTCVGEKNHKFFWLFLLFINIVIIFSMALAVRSFPRYKSTKGELTGSDIGMTLLMIIDCVVLVIGGLSTLSLFGYHSYLMLTNQTTWESISRRRISYLKKLRDDMNPFHLGYCANIYSFCCKCSPRQWRSVYRRSTSNMHLLEEI